MDDYTRYHIQKIHSKINSYTFFELEILNKGIVQKVNELSEDNESYQNTKAMLAYSDLNTAIVNRILELEDMSNMEMDNLVCYNSRREL